MKRKIYILAVVFVAFVAQTWAREFEVGERLYINGRASNSNYWRDGVGSTVKLWAQFKDGGSDYWIEAVNYNGTDNYYFEIPVGAARNWTKVVLHRTNNNRSVTYNSTGEIPLDYLEDDADYLRNYIQNFEAGQTWATWWCISPVPSFDPSVRPYVDLHVCTDAAGSDFILSTNPGYSKTTKNHAWYKYENGSWSRINGDEYRNYEDEIRPHVNLGGVNSDTYYYLVAGKPSACRLMRVRVDKDCSDGTVGACAITSFVGVASDANVTDETSAIDGLVAFDDKVNAGKLIVWCPEIDTVEFANVDLEIPQTFKLEGFPATAVTTYTLYAKFEDGVGCEASCNVTVRPPTAPITTHTTTQTISDMRLKRFTEEDVTLSPTNQTSTHWRWTNSVDNDTVRDTDPGSPIRNYTFTAPTDQKNITYVFLAANEPEASQGNLIKNGDFEYNGDFTSNYDYWGTDEHNFYDSHSDYSGGYALSQSSNYFYPTYNDVTPHHGTYFGLFDSKVNSGLEDQAAWVANTSQNPKLKVQAGVSYLFSFWVANINNFGEMHNCARLQFQISYNGGSSWNNLGGEINLNNYIDNRWHGLSSIATPTISSDNVAIRVINNNKSTDNYGNDFALDDIRFEAVTSRSSNIAAYEKFPVQYLKCNITGATFAQRQPVGCGTTVADVDFTVNFVNPRGDLYIYEGTNHLATIPNATILGGHDVESVTSYTGVLANQPVDNADHVITVYFEDPNVRTDAPTTYSYNAKAVPSIDVKTLTWTTPSCDIATCTLTAVIRYTNQNGTLTANVDGGAAVTQTYIIESDDTKEVTLIIPGVLADGKMGHTLNVEFDGSHGCSIINYDIPTAAPYMPNISAYNATIQPYACGDAQYSVKVEATFANSQAHNLIIEDWNSNKQVITTIATDTHKEYTFFYNWETPTTHEYKIYFVGAEACAENHKPSFTAPAEPAIAGASPTFGAMDCDLSTYTLSAVVTYTNQDGTLTAWVDGGAKQTFTYDANHSTSKTVTLNISGLPADGESHKLNVEFDGSHGCRLVEADGNAVDYVAPFAPVISAVTVTPQDMKCGETQYQVTVEATLSANAVGKTLTVKGDNGTNTYTISSTSFSQVYTVTRSSASGKFNIYFADADNCPSQQTKDYIYAVPTVPTLTVNPVVIPTPSCDQTTFNLSVSGSYEYLHGSHLSFLWDGVEKTTQSISPLTVGTVGATLSGLVYDGNAHTLTVKTDDAVYDCEVIQSAIAVPFMPAISGVTVSGVTDRLDCNQLSYNAVVDATYTNGAGKNIVVEYTDGGSLQTQTVAVSALPLTLTLTDINDGMHNVRVWFEGYESCATTPAHAATYQTPVFATIYGNFSINTTEIQCETTNYDLSGQVTFDVADGDLIVEYDAAHRVVIPSPVSPQDFTIVGITDQVTNQSVYAWFSNNPSCVAPSAKFDSPIIPSIQSVTINQPVQASCDAGTYEAEFIVVSQNQHGGLVVTDENGNVLYTNASPTANQAGTIILPTDASLHNLTFTFTGANDCSTAQPVMTLGKPTLSLVKLSEQPIGCGETTYTAQFQVSYSNQTTTLTLHDKDGVAYGTWTPADDGAYSHVVNVTRPLNATLQDELIAEFASAGFGIDVCEQHLVYDLPAQYGIESFSLGTPSYADPCGLTYQIPFEIIYSGLTGNLILADANDGDRVVWQGDAAEGKAVLSTTANVESMSLHAWFANNTPCVSDIVNVNSLPTPTLQVSKQGDRIVDFVNNTFTEQIQIQFANQDDRTLYIAVDGTELTHYDSPTSPLVYTYNGVANNQPVAVDIYFDDLSCKQVYSVVAQPQPIFSVDDPIMTTPDCGSAFTMTLKFTYANVSPNANLVVVDENDQPLTGAAGVYTYNAIADGQNHTFTVWFDDNPSVTKTFNFTYPVATTLTFQSSSVSALDVDTMYVPTITFSSTNLTGALVVEDNNGNVIVPTSVGVDNFVLPALKADGLTHSGVFYYAQCPNIRETYTFQSPAVPQLTIVPSIENVACDGNYDAVFTMTYANQYGNLIVADMNGQVLDSYTQGTQPVVWRENVPADGSQYAIQVWFDGGAKRVATSSLVAPITGVITQIETDTFAIICNDPTYDLKVKLTVLNPTSNVIVECGGQTISVPFTSTIGTAENEIIISNLSMSSPASTLKAYFESRTDCDLTITPLHNIQRNCIYVDDIICEDATYSNYGLTIPNVGMADKHTHQVVDTIINLYVVQQPTIAVTETAGQRICSTETNYDISIAATGESDVYSISFSDSQFTNVVDAPLVNGVQFTIPADVKPGKYTATVTLGHHATECTVADDFTFEISAGDMIYSKWDDVLLVANRDGLFSAYQWYHNGQIMEGETLQRLYNPADMTGTFYCEVTMEDGTRFTTCDGEFAQAPFSRDQNTITPTNPAPGKQILVHRADAGEGQIGVYTVTGQQVMEFRTTDVDTTITAPQQSGVYVIMVVNNGYQWTQKIIVK